MIVTAMMTTPTRNAVAHWLTAQHHKFCRPHVLCAARVLAWTSWLLAWWFSHVGP